MDVEVSAAEPFAVGADLVAVAAGPNALALGAPERAVEDADPVAIVYTDGAPLAVVSGDSHTAAARAVRACRGTTVAWALSEDEPIGALAEGAVIGGYDPRGRPGVERFVICGASAELAPVAERAELVARWTNVARELVDGPPNVHSPAGLAERAAALPRLRCETVDAAEAGLSALAAVGGSGPI